MGHRTKTPPPVKLFFALMAGDDETLFEECECRLAERFGPLDLRDEPYAFDPLTDFYAREFGHGLVKRIVAARDLIAPEELVEIKNWTNALETEMATGPSKRAINIDPGYLSLSKVILATTKDQAHRIYIGQGILEEVTLNYRRVPARYEPNPWTYADYRMEGRVAYFSRLRAIYHDQIKEAR